MDSSRPFPADGFDAAWTSLDQSQRDDVTLRWENEAWTATGRISGIEIEYVLRLSPLWDVRQFLLFRDLDEPDLWLGTDGGGRWGEVNGAHRPDLDGAFDIALVVTPFTHVLPIRRLPIGVGRAAELRCARVDVDTLGVVVADQIVARLEPRRWRIAIGDVVDEFDVDEYGLPLDVAGRFVRSR